MSKKVHLSGVFFPFSFLLFFALLAKADRMDELTLRVNQLEKQQANALLLSIHEEARISSFHNDHFTIGGFFEHAVTTISGQDTSTQTNSANSLLGFNVSAEYNQHFRFVSQFITGLSVPLQNPNNDPNAASLGLPRRREFKSALFGALVAQAYLEYITKGGFHIQGGMGYVPFGHSFQLREPVLFFRRGGAQILRTRNLVSALWTGLHIYDEFRSYSTRWGYHAYTFTSFLSPKVPGLGARVWLRPSEENLIIGISNQYGKQGAEFYDTLGMDVHWKKDRWIVTSEIAAEFLRGLGTWAVHLEPGFSFDMEEWIVYAFGDYANSSQNLTLTRLDPFEKWEYGFGVNWLPISYARIRAGLTMNDYVGGTAVIDGQNRDDVSLDFSVGVAF